jgi:D-beta-D-heptose 7-phosphate kinase/D-beta-D-heptose 1-phosphate adenosyltransferase
MNTVQQKSFKILLIGDTCRDVYQYGAVTRLSPEAPVPVFIQTDTLFGVGMAENVKANLEQFGCEVTALLGRISVKTRLIDEKSKQHLLRMDDDVYSEPLGTVDVAQDTDAVVISDYGKGFVTYELIEHIRTVYDGPILIDTKKTDLSRFAGCIVKINELEYSKVTSINDDLIVTCGERGAMRKVMFNETHYPAQPVAVTDVCGAGDTFLAALTYKFLDTANINTAIEFAIKASAVTVQHLGNYAPRLEEIQ